jgi:two-component system response regulator PilR (NtrC family)
MADLMEHTFPGNIRELENIIQRALALCEADKIDSADLQLPEKTDLNLTGTTDSAALDSFLADKEKERILQALEKTRWNKTAAAKVLGISFRALRYRLEKLGID